MLRTLTLLISISLFSLPSYACTEPSTDQLKAFFGKANLRGSNLVGKLARVRINVNFSSPLHSTLSAKGKTAAIRSFCMIGNDQIKVVTDLGQGSVVKRGNKLTVITEGNPKVSLISSLRGVELSAQEAVVRKSFSPKYYKNKAVYRAPTSSFSSQSSGAIDI